MYITQRYVGKELIASRLPCVFGGTSSLGCAFKDREVRVHHLGLGLGLGLG